MGGGLMQLVVYGAQDKHLTGNPQISFFKVVYKRYTHFSIESIEQSFNGQVDFDRKSTCVIERQGDLIHKIYVKIELNNIDGKNFRWVNWLGNVMIDYVELEIGGQKIDKHYGEWLYVWNELSQKPTLKTGYANLVGNLPALTMKTNKTPSCTLYVPLQFWFCRNSGLALPLISLQYHKVNINVKFKSLLNCCFPENVDTSLIKLKASLFVDYIFLDTEERRQFAQTAHEYLIEQLQFVNYKINNTEELVKINFTHPVKELVWVIQKNEVLKNKQWFNFTDSLDNTFGTGIVNDPYGDGMINSHINNISNTSNFAYGNDFTIYHESTLTSALDQNTLKLNSIADSTDDIYNNMTFEIIGGLSNTFKSTIGDYSGTTKIIDLVDNIIDNLVLVSLSPSDAFTSDSNNFLIIKLLDTNDVNTFWNTFHRTINISGISGTIDDTDINKEHTITSFLGFNLTTNSTILVSQLTGINTSVATANYGNEYANNTSKYRIFNTNTLPTLQAVTGAGITNLTNHINVYDNGYNPVLSASLQINGNNRFNPRNGRYFNLVQPFQHHTGIPPTGINVYSFALNPEDHQPSGTLNMSKINTTYLNLKLTSKTFINSKGNKDTANIRIYGINYNVLRILSGLAGLAYSH